MIYKYRGCAQRTWEILLNRKLYFASPTELNDPLDSTADIFAEYEKAKSILLDAETNDVKKQHLSMLLVMLNNGKQFIDNETGERTRFIQYLSSMLQSCGILSFSATATDPLLWSHYANGHRGIALGFDETSLDFGTDFMKADVLYEAEPNYPSFFKELAEILDYSRQAADPNVSDNVHWNKFFEFHRENSIIAVLLVKSNKWDYEKEYRVISSEAGQKKFEPSILKEVVRGIKMSEPDKETLSNILSHPNYAHVKVKDVKHKEGTFEFELVDSPQEPIKK